MSEYLHMGFGIFRFDWLSDSLKSFSALLFRLIRLQCAIGGDKSVFMCC